jgi:hypothetical protein
MAASGVALEVRTEVERLIALLAALSWLAALIHAAVVPEHWSEHEPFAVCFALLAVVQGGWAVAFFRRPTAGLLAFAAVLSFGVAAVWALSRTTGLPVGPEAGTAEPVGSLDVAATAVELFLGVVAVGLVRTWPATSIPRWLIPMGTVLLLAGGVALVIGGHAH